MLKAAQALTKRIRSRPLLVRGLMLVSYCVGILVLGTVRNGAIPGMNFVASDKVLHGVVFGGLAVLTYRLSNLRWSSRGSLWHVGLSVFWATGFGALLEIVQSFTRYRSAELADLFADLFGAILFVALAVALRLERPIRLLLS